MIHTKKSSSNGRNLMGATRGDVINFPLRGYAPQARKQTPAGGLNGGRGSGLRRVWAAPNEQKNGKNAGAVFVRFGQGARTMPCSLPAVTALYAFYVFAGFAHVTRFISGVSFVFFFCAGMNPTIIILSAAAVMFNINFNSRRCLI